MTYRNKSVPVSNLDQKVVRKETVSQGFDSWGRKTVAGSWKHMNYSQFKPGKGKEEEGMTRKHTSRKWSSPWPGRGQEGGRGSSLTRGLNQEWQKEENKLVPQTGELRTPGGSEGGFTVLGWVNWNGVPYLRKPGSSSLALVIELKNKSGCQVHCGPVITKEGKTR